MDLTDNKVLWAQIYVGFHGFYDLGSFDDGSPVVHLQHAGFGGFRGNGRDYHVIWNLAGRFVRIRIEFHVDSQSISKASLAADFRCDLTKFEWASCVQMWQMTPIWRLLAFYEIGSQL